MLLGSSVEFHQRPTLILHSSLTWVTKRESEINNPLQRLQYNPKQDIENWIHKCIYYNEYWKNKQQQKSISDTTSNPSNIINEIPKLKHKVNLFTASTEVNFQPAQPTKSVVPVVQTNSKITKQRRPGKRVRAQQLRKKLRMMQEVSIIP
ncbi:unnamed protein product [Allacma fusca]|uniref:Uncharacterized protein n=1 Tax=Allacma fusca TaxID=39272 RepID=A0A8J2KFQ5_9HEXA|nr:unnamed protein product [Allacma fusca]